MESSPIASPDPSNESTPWTSAADTQVLLIAGEQPWPLAWTELGTALGRKATSCEERWRVLVRWREDGKAQMGGRGLDDPVEKKRKREERRREEEEVVSAVVPGGSSGTGALGRAC